MWVTDRLASWGSLPGWERGEGQPCQRDSGSYKMTVIAYYDLYIDHYCMCVFYLLRVIY